MLYVIDKNAKMKRTLLAFICTKTQLWKGRTAHFMAILLVQKKNTFSQKTGNKYMYIGQSIGIGASNQHELVSW